MVSTWIANQTLVSGFNLCFAEIKFHFPSAFCTGVFTRFCNAFSMYIYICVCRESKHGTTDQAYLFRWWWVRRTAACSTAYQIGKKNASLAVDFSWFFCICSQQILVPCMSVTSRNIWRWLMQPCVGGIAWCRCGSCKFSRLPCSSTALLTSWYNNVLSYPFFIFFMP